MLTTYLTLLVLSSVWLQNWNSFEVLVYDNEPEPCQCPVLSGIWYCPAVLPEIEEGWGAAHLDTTALTGSEDETWLQPILLAELCSSAAWELKSQPTLTTQHNQHQI